MPPGPPPPQYWNNVEFEPQGGDLFGHMFKVLYICFMNWKYISGFFDADGYVTLVRDRKDKPRTVIVGFTNSKIIILETIQNFILIKTGLKGFISKKTSKKESRADGYDLKYTHFPKALKILFLMKYSIHPKKQKRYEILKKIHVLTPRNGKYNQQMLSDRTMLEEEFLKTL